MSVTDGESVGEQTRRVVSGVELGIREGMFPGGTPIPSYRALAKRYEVSRNTVIRAVDILVERGLVYRKERSGTYVCVSSNGCDCEKSASRLQAVTFIEKQQPYVRARFHQDYMAGYTEALESHDLKMRFEVWRDNVQRYDELFSDLFPLSEQGCVLVNFTDAALMEWLWAKDVPFVVQYYCYYPEEDLPPHSRVFVNKVKAGHDAAWHLLNIGHRRIGFAGTSKLPTGLPGLFDGYRVAMLCAGACPHKRDVLEFRTDDVEAALPYLRRYLNTDDLPSAVFCETDGLAIAVLEAAGELGIAIPEDLSVVGYNDLPGAANASPPLTTVAAPRRFLAKTAAAMLLSMAEDDAPEPRERILECHLQIRESTLALDGF